MMVEVRGRAIVLDTCVIINLYQRGQIDILCRHCDYRFVIPEEVREEVTYEDQAKTLAQAIDSRVIRVASLTDPTEQAFFATLKKRMGKGEAACLAHCACHGWTLCSDDKGRAFVRLVREHIGSDRLMDTEDLVALILRGRKN